MILSKYIPKLTEESNIVIIPKIENNPKRKITWCKKVREKYCKVCQIF